MTQAATALYTACNRVRPSSSSLIVESAETGERLVTTRLAAILKGWGVGDKYDEMYTQRRAALDARFRALLPAGDAAYWRHIEGAGAEPSLPLEILVRCTRERITAGAMNDAQRIFTVIMLRIQSSLGQRAWKVAQQARSGMKPQLRDELEQDFYEKLWKELAADGPTFLEEHFATAFERLFQHVAHDAMERAGEWRRPGVEQPTRIPRSETESIEARPKGEDEVPLVEQMADTSVDHAFDQAELSDLLALVMSLPEDQRTIILDRYWHERSQEDTAKTLDISERTVRNRLKQILRELRLRYQGGEENNHA